MNNVKASVATTPNKVVITGMGKYGGTKTLEFRIKGRPNRIVTGSDSYTKYLTSKEFNLDAEAAEAKQLIYTSGNEDVVTVTVKPLKPVVTLSSPQKKQVKVSWTKQEGAT